MAQMSSPILEKPAKLDPAYTNPKTKSKYFVTRSRLDGRGRLLYRLTVEEHIADWRYVEQEIPAGYWVDLPLRGKPMLKRMK